MRTLQLSVHEISAVDDRAKAHRDVFLTATDAAIADYREMPGLSLTVPQAALLWHLDREMAEGVMHLLVCQGFLRENDRHRFVRANGCSR